MSPGPNGYIHGHLPPGTAPSSSQDDALMSDAASHSHNTFLSYLEQQSWNPETINTLAASVHHHHHHNHHYYHPNPHHPSNHYNPAPHPHPYAWPTPNNAMHHAIYNEGSSLIHNPGSMNPIQGPHQAQAQAQSDAQDTAAAASGTPSFYIANNPHVAPLPQPAVPNPQPISLDAGSWLHTAPGPVPPFHAHPVNPQVPPVSLHLQQIQSLQGLQAPPVAHGHNEDGDQDDYDQDQPTELLALLAQPNSAPQPHVPIQLLGLSYPNPNSLGPDNPQLFQFLRRWIYRPRVYPTPKLEELNVQSAMPERVVHREDLMGDKCDLQGINWFEMGTTRNKARIQRRATYKNYVCRSQSDMFKPGYEIPSDDSFFRFRRMDIKDNVHLTHFQLRNTLSCVSRSLAFYPSRRSVQQINPVSGKNTMAMNLADIAGIHVSTLSAKHGLLVVGGFNGEYYVKSLDSIQDQEPGFHEGHLTDNLTGITNHVQVYQGRTTGSPMATFASNDSGFKTLDLNTNRVVSEAQFKSPMNCSAISPDKRLRVLVGDQTDVIICNADTNEVLQKLRSHRDFGFACDWSEDGWTVATGFQDMDVKIWDARRWTDSNGIATPVSTIRANMAGPRSLRFSPLGTGKPVLVAAEEADYINIIDAVTFASRQTFDVFGEIGGIDFANDGRDLMVLCCDEDRGGLMQLERTLPTLLDSYDSDEDYPFMYEVENGLRRRNRTVYTRRRNRAACPVDIDLF